LFQEYGDSQDVGETSFSVGETDDVVLQGGSIEGRWADEALRLNMTLGARTLISINALVTTLQLWTYLRKWRRGHKCSYPEPWPWWVGSFATVLELSFLLGSSLLLLSCLKRPRPFIYFSILIGWAIYLLLLGLPPMSLSCIELFHIYTCAGSKSERVTTATETLDCTPQAHTMVQLYMTWLLLTPRLYPRTMMMHFNWIWILFMHPGVTLLYREYSREKFYSLADIAFTTFLLSVTNFVALSKKFYISKSQRNKFLYDLKQREASENMFHILEYMVPVHVIVNMLKNPGAVIAEPIDCVSILFVMIVDFDTYARSYSPENLLAFLNQHFTLFDSICAQHEVTKIETVGEEFVCAVGVVPKDIEQAKIDGCHAEILGRLVRVGSDILNLQSGKVKFKLGAHTGPLVAGVIGLKLPRFRLFGDTINTAARMMQKGEPGKMQFGEETRRALPHWANAKLRGEIEMKGKGQVTTYYLDCGTDREAQQSAKSQHEGVRHRIGFAMDAELEPASGDGGNSRNSSNSVCIGSSAAHGSRGSHAITSLGTARPTIVAQILAGSGAGQATAIGEVTGGVPTNSSLVLAMSPHRPSATPSFSGRPSARASGASTECLGAPSFDAVSSVKPERRKGRTRLPHESQVSSQHSMSSTNVSEASRTTWSINSNKQSVASRNSDPEFEKALQEVSDTHRHDEGDTSRWSCGAKVVKFPNMEMEAEWFRWYHESQICKKLDDRLDKQELAVAVLTTLDTLWLVFSDATKADHVLFEAGLRLPIFLTCRLIVFGIIFAWRNIARHNHWIRLEPHCVQHCLSMSYLLIAALLYFSYDSMSFLHRLLEKGTDSKVEDMIWIFQQRFRRGGTVFSLILVPVFFLVTTQHPLLFRHSMAFVGLAAVLVSLGSTSWAALGGELIFSSAGRFMFIMTALLNALSAFSAEQSSRARYRSKRTLEDTHERIEKILNTLMPPLVVEEIRDLPVNAPLPSHHYACATIAQSDLVGFTKLASTRQPYEVVEFIGELFGDFDELTDRHGVYKVETVGDAYIAGQADFPLTLKNRPASVALFGIDMVKATVDWSRRRGVCVACRVGVHTGECIGGIVGSEMQRYHLFGELMSCLEVLESTAPEGRVQVSGAFREAAEIQMRAEGLPKEFLTFEQRTEPSLTTSKGEVHDFDEVGGRTYVIRSHLEIRGCLGGGD